MDSGELKELLEGAIRERLPGVSITGVQVKRDYDAEGGELLEVTIVFEAPSDLDPERIVSLIRYLRPRLLERGEKGFPVMSFVSKREAKQLGFAAG